MGLGVLVDVALGVLAIMILFSLAASAINEFIADNIRGLRSATLEKAIRGLLKDQHLGGNPTDGEVKTALKAFYDDPGIKALMRGSSKPSAIEPRRYALTVLNVLKNREALGDRAVAAAVQAKEGLKELVMRVASEMNAKAAGAATAAEIEAFSQRAGDLVADARGKLDIGIAKLEGDFRDAMDRVSGWYVRKTKMNLFVIGLALAAGANVDLLNYADRLLTEASLRDRAAAYADLLAAERGTAPVAAPGATIVDDARAEIATMVEALNGLDVKIGWDCVAYPEIVSPGARPVTVLDPMVPYVDMRVLGAFCDDAAGFAAPTPSQVGGWLIIAFGVTLGAPFWFDLFRRVAKLRTAGATGGVATAKDA